MKRNILIAFSLLLLIGVALAFICRSGLKSPYGVKRVVFVTIDTLRADHMQSYGYLRETSPFLDELAKSSVVFEKAYSQAPHTAPSHASMFTGLFPFQHKVLRNHEVLSPSIPNLHSFLTALSIKNAAFPSVGFLNGKVSFPESPVSMQLNNPGRPKRQWYLAANEVVNNALTWIKSEKPDEFFIWLHFYDVHQWAGWGNLPPKYREMMESSGDQKLSDFVKENHRTPLEFFKTEEKLLRAMNGYDARIRFVDDELKRLHSELQALGLGSDSLWIVTSDHGEGLGNHNYKGHGEYLYQEQLHVPLIINSSEMKFRPKRISELVRMVDLYPTLLEVIGEDSTSKNIEGISLLPLLTEGIWKREKVTNSYAERRPKDLRSFRRFWEDGEVYSLHDHSFKLIEKSLGEDELYDLSKDPFELEILGSGGDKEAKLRDSLNKIRKRDHGGSASNEEPELSSDEVEELKSLGYL